MSAIFSQAVRSIKTNPDSGKKRLDEPSKKIINHNDSSGGKKGSILDRIKINKGANKQRKEITLRRDSPEPEVPGIQRKIISKDKNFHVSRSHEKSDSDEVWKHDRYDGPAVPVTSNANCTVFVRNLPDSVDREALCSILDDDPEISGLRLENGTAEIHFKRRDAALNATEILNGKTLRGKTLKAGIVGDLNAGQINPKIHNTKLREEEKKDQKEFIPKKKMHMDDVSVNKSSILNRIKKNH